MHPVGRIRRIIPVMIGSESCELTEPVEQKRSYWHNPSHSLSPWRWRANSFEKQRVSLRGVYTWAVNSIVTKHSDFFVSKDTAECVTRRCDDTSWQDASEFLCIKTSFFKGGQQQKNRQKNPGNALSDELLVSFFHNFAADAANKKTTFCAVFETALYAVLINELMK